MPPNLISPHFKVTVVLVILFLLSSIEHTYCFRLLFRQRVRFQYRSVLSDSTANLNPADTPIDSLKMMKLVELKSLVKRLGGKAGTLRKAELVEECTKYLTSSQVRCVSSTGSGISSLSGDSAGDDSSARSSRNVTSSSKPASTGKSKKLRNLEPLDPYESPVGKFTSVIDETIQQKFNVGKSAPKSISQSAVTTSGTSSHSTSITSKPSDSRASAYISNSNSNSISNKIKNYTNTTEDTERKSTTNHSSKNTRRIRYPVGELRDQRLQDDLNGEMELTFLGTASCVPSVTRGVSCVAMRYMSDTWMFDCGEATQVQLQKSRVKPSRVKKIFITHAHGDHSFGLPGVLCLIGQSIQAERERLVQDGGGRVVEPIDIYGPEGIRDLVRAVVQLSYSRVVVPFRVHELKQVPYLHSQFVRAPSTPMIRTRFDANYGEREGSRDIYPDENGHYHLFTETDGMTVTAAAMQHTVPCVGYVVQEQDRQGSLRPELVKDVVEKNREALKAKLGGTHMKVFRDLKDLGPDDVYEFPDGTTVCGRDIVEEPKKGRKLVFMGDTCSGKHIQALAQNADVLVHEATNAYLPDSMIEDQQYDGGYEQLAQETVSHGHSTPQMAGRFAADIRAKRLILTHFSSRYKGDNSFESMQLMWRIEEHAREAMQAQAAVLDESAGECEASTSSSLEMISAHERVSKAASAEEQGNDVIAAWDLMSMPVRHANVAAKRKSIDCTIRK